MLTLTLTDKPGDRDIVIGPRERPEAIVRLTRVERGRVRISIIAPLDRPVGRGRAVAIANGDLAPGDLDRATGHAAAEAMLLAAERATEARVRGAGESHRTKEYAP